MTKSPLVVFEHKLSQVLGKLTGANFNSKGEIEVEAEIYRPPPDSPLAATYHLVRNGVLRAMSIGGKWKKLPGTDGVTKLFTTEVVEASICGVGANADALFEVVGRKSIGGDLDDELSRLNELTDAGLDAALERLGSL
jgi:hypothetical protein